MSNKPVKGLRVGNYRITPLGLGTLGALALILGLAVLFAAALPVQGKALPAKAVLTVADHEYGIYLYHLVIIQNTMALSSAFRTVTAKCLPLSMLAYILLSVAVGIVSSKCISRAKH